MDLLAKLRAARIIPVIRHHDYTVASAVCDTLIENGMTMLEITTTVPGYDDLISQLRTDHPEILVGTGTVMNTTQLERARKADSGFAVSLILVQEVAEARYRHRNAICPGAMTPNEIAQCWSSGAAMVKIFPAHSVGGPGFVRGVQDVFPEVPLMPSGGVLPELVKAYIDAGATCVGMGGGLVPVSLVALGDHIAEQNSIKTALDACFES